MDILVEKGLTEVHQSASGAMNSLVFGRDVEGRKRLQEILRKRGHEVVTTDDLHAARDLYDRHRPQMVFLIGVDGHAHDLAKFVRRLEGERTVVVGYVADGEEAAATNALGANVDDTILGRRDAKDLAMKIALAERRADRRRRWYELEVNLRDSESRYRLLAEHATDMISRHDPGGLYVYASPACRHLLGYEPEELIGRSAYDFFHPDDVQQIKQSHDAILDRPNASTVSYRLRRKDGSYALVETTSRTIRNEVTGELESIIAVTRDVGDRHRLRRDMRWIERELADTQRLARVGSWYWDLDTDKVMWTDEVFRILGRDVQEFVPTVEHFLKHIHPDDRGRVASMFERIRSEENQVELTFRIVRPGGEIRVLAGRGEIEIGDHGERLMVGTVQDVTDLVSAAKALEAQEAHYRAILETSVDGVITIDESGMIRSFNKAAERIFGFDASEVIGQSVKVLMPPYYAVEHDSYLRSYLETGHRKIIGIGREVVGQRKDGTTFPMDLAVSEVLSGDRRLFSGIVRDVSERRQLEQEILNTTEQERQRIGQDLHDGLGQMLTGIGLITKNLVGRLRSKGVPEAKEMEEVCDLIGDADEFARSLARGLIPVELDADGLASAFRRLVINARRLFDIECTFEQMGGHPEIDNAIATHLYRIAQEALSNAVRHAQASQFKIALATGEDQIRLRLTDDGKGISEDIGDDHPGMGIRIMRYRARIIGATLEIRGRTEGGTTVVCTLPRSESLQAHPLRNTGGTE